MKCRCGHWLEKCEKCGRRNVCSSCEASRLGFHIVCRECAGVKSRKATPIKKGRVKGAQIKLHHSTMLHSEVI